ncbi:IS4 family transposase [Chroococcidiopsis sp. FACHB-1243]|uniref:IS4 family transposase n=1 Tax=Chroococcidiopsis sp. [FACHB-1243] TaxID=2692781 RepID=UPI00177B4063|nr:IS4 family transposase [Chroococcidiopsis sp. [FACHB-1243]]MBD2306482.1 IS4 family transposase [Chroococcidiopsis sp. [FACHB-1243]]
MIPSFHKLVKQCLANLPKNDFPVLSTRLFVECWLGYVMDKSLTSMRDLFARLNLREINCDISTFSKASKHRSLEPFIKIYQQLNSQLQQKNSANKLVICPIDTTVITLTSKLLWQLGYHQVKLISSLNLSTEAVEENLVNFGWNHDYNYGKEMIEALPENGIGVMDRGFASLTFLRETCQTQKYFVVRISQLYKLEYVRDSELIKVGTGKEAGLYRAINFCDLETKREYRLVTNLPAQGEAEVNDAEVAEIYRQRWGIELLWKFLKMHLKLDELITKNPNGIAIQIYATLIAYLILQLVEIPQAWGNKLLDKLRYLQAFMCQEISYVHWMEKLMKC